MNFLKLFLNIRRLYNDYFSVLINVYIKKCDVVLFLRDNNKFFVRGNSRDFNTINEIFIFDEYDYKVWDGYNINTIIDVGANIGVFSVFAKKMYPHASLLCFEPSTNNFNVLKKNLLLNKINNVCINYGVSNKSEIHDFYECINHYESSSSSNMWALDHKKVSARFVSIHYVYSLTSSNDCLLKFDVEGDEYKIFSSMYNSELLRNKVIIIEYHNGDHDFFVLRLLRIGFVVQINKKSDLTGVIIAVRKREYNKNR